MNALSTIIPDSLKPDYILKPNAFSRDRALPLRHLFAFLLSAVSTNKNSGIAIRLNEFFSTATISGLWEKAPGCTASAVTKARQKVDWKAFRDMFLRAVQIARETLPPDPKHLWHGKQVIAIDGSKYTLPHTKEILDTFDSSASLQSSGKGHYPQCMVVTAYDALAEIPVAIQVSPVYTSERAMAQNVVQTLPKGAVLVLDRGYPSFKLQHFLHNSYEGDYLIRCSSYVAFSAVLEFAKSGIRQQVISITPPASVRSKMQAESGCTVLPLTVRALRVESSNGGTVSVLLTTLLDFEKYSYEELVGLYFKRWPVEVHFRNDKCILEIEKFHTRSANGIQQEIFAAATVSVITRILTNIEAIEGMAPKPSLPQFKNAVSCLASYAAMVQE